jgi:2-octaprenyl-6-methoxyphenol hydroxylase
MAEPRSAPELSVDVVIVGAGLAGLSLALALARDNVRVALVGPSERIAKGRTVALLDPSMRFFERLGIVEQIQAVAAPLSKLSIIDDAGSLIRAPSLAFKAAELGLEAFGWNVENARLTEILETRVLANSAVRRVLEPATAFSFLASHAEIASAGGLRIAAPLVVGADGRNSPSRRAAAIDETVVPYDQSALTAIFSHRRPHDGQSVEFHKRGGPFTLVPLPAGENAEHRSSLVWALPRRQAEELTALSDEAWLLRVEAEAHAVFGTMCLKSARGMFPLQRVKARRFAGSRLALVGEAAHALPPIGAQGFNLSVKDVAALVEVVTETRAGQGDFGADQALARYCAMREPDASRRALAVDALNRSLLADFLPLDGARAAALAAIGALPPLRRMAMRAGLGA